MAVPVVFHCVASLWAQGNRAATQGAALANRPAQGATLERDVVVALAFRRANAFDEARCVIFEPLIPAGF